jgi:AcrR family transcriptional regulator
MSTSPARTSQRPTKADLLARARATFLRGERLDLPALGAALGLSRATVYRWAGDGDQLAGEVIAGLLRETHERLRRAERGRGAARVLRLIVRGMRAIASFAPYRAFIARDPERALRIVASKEGPVQRTTIALHEALLAEEIAAGHLQLPVDAHAMAYALTRIVESFLYADLITGETPDLDKAEQILALMLGTSP